jgi:hypothetical protein
MTIPEYAVVLSGAVMVIPVVVADMAKLVLFADITA